MLLGAVFALLGLTGSVLCFYPELDLWLNPAQQVTVSQPELPGVQRMVDALHAAYPEHRGAWRLEMPLSAGRPINARYYQPPETAGRGFAPLMLTLDPATLPTTLPTTPGPASTCAGTSRAARRSWSASGAP